MRLKQTVFLCLVIVGTVAGQVSLSQLQKSRLINGTPVAPGTYPQVIRLRAASGYCTGTIVGPRVIATAGHCGGDGDTISFNLNGNEYRATMTHSPLFPQKDHDIALGLIDKAITQFEPISIGGTASVGLGVEILGYGCTEEGGGGTSGTLRKGGSTITGFLNFDMLTKEDNGAYLCFGDSGGPTFIKQNGKNLLLGVNSKVEDTWDLNYSIRTDSSESQSFFKDFAQKKSVEICGVNKQCGSVDPPPTQPTCTISAFPSEIKKGESLTLTLQSQGQVSQAAIDGQPVPTPIGRITFTPPNAGTLTSWGQVSGQGGTGSCQTTYTVVGEIDPTSPTCTLTATPEKISLGDSLTLSLQTQGNVEEAKLNGQIVNTPFASKTITPVAKGSFSAWGSVRGPGGNGICKANYVVGKDDPLPPNVPLLTVVPTYCGYNTLGETNVWKACLAVLRKDSNRVGMQVSEAILITYRDTTTEVLPILHKKARSYLSLDGGSIEDVTVYANRAVKKGTHWVLDSQEAKITYKEDPQLGRIPKRLEGRTPRTTYYIVDQLGPTRTDDLLGSIVQ